MPVYNVTRIGSAVGGYGDEVSLAVIRDGSSVATSSRNQNGYIEFTLWTLLSGGGIQIYSQLSADPQAAARVAGIGVGRFVTAGQSTHGGHIKSIFWIAGANTGEGSAAQGHNAAIAAFPNLFAIISPPANPPPPGTSVVYPEGYLAATAHVTEDHHVRVTSWFAGEKIASGISTLASAKGGEAIFTSIVAKQTFLTATNLTSADVVTAVTTVDNLHLGAWRLHVDGSQPLSVEHLHGVAANEPAKEVALAAYPPDPATVLVAAIVTPAGDLKLIAWQMQNDGGFTRWLDTTAGAASEVSCAWVTGSIVVTACKTGSGVLKLIYWQLPASPTDPQTITRLTDIEGGSLPSFGGVSVGHWRAANASANDLGETLVGVRTAAGDLKVIRFHLTSS
ncbi:MAG TPA: hypothetical protein VGF59_05625 [Bryobacteraceae bacterium]|jgi:hypothetical protein